MPLAAPSFWSDRSSVAARLLAPVGLLYGAATRWRMTRPGLVMNVPVLCVGNPTVGGVGKTPFAAMLAQNLRERGARPAILTRGYGGSLKGPVVVDPARHQPQDVGDEALLHAAHTLTIASRQRVKGAALAVSHGATHVILDDGFQNPSLYFDLAFLLVDARAGLGNGYIFPAGPLRTDFASQAARADIVVIIGGHSGPLALPAIERIFGETRPVIRARLLPDPVVAASLEGKSLLGFCGIGLPEKFRQTLLDCGAKTVELMAFPDHHVYRDAEARQLLDDARARDLMLVTTTKDAVKLRGSPALEALAATATVLPVALKIEEGEDHLSARLAAMLSP